MSQHERRHDDAPIETSKTHSGERDLLVQTVTINKPAREVYAFFRDFSNLPRFMENIESIDILDDDRSHWRVKAPGGKVVEWDARVTEDVEGESITWSSEEGADVVNSGRIVFADAGVRGTVVSATIAYKPPGGAVGKFIAKLFQREPHIQARRDLRRLKQYLEAGEIATNARNRRMLLEEEA